MLRAVRFLSVVNGGRSSDFLLALVAEAGFALPTSDVIILHFFQISLVASGAAAHAKKCVRISTQLTFNSNSSLKGKNK